MASLRRRRPSCARQDQSGLIVLGIARGGCEPGALVVIAANCG
jgi:hypothetical protein